MSLKELGRNPVEFAVSDGSSIKVSEYAVNFLREFCDVDRVKAVAVAGGRYLYMPRKMSEFLGVLSVYSGQVGRYVTWPLTDFLARHVYHLHLYLPGEGRIRHDGSDSFLPGNFARDAWSEPEPVPVSEPEPEVSEPVAQKVSPVIEQQVAWFDGDLRQECCRIASKKLNAGVAEDVVHDVWCELLAAVLRGKCIRTVREEFNKWVKGALKYRCCDIAKPGSKKKKKPGSDERPKIGCVNGDILPDPLEVKLANQKNSIRRGELPDETQSHWAEMGDREQAVSRRNYAAPRSARIFF